MYSTVINKSDKIKKSRKERNKRYRDKIKNKKQLIKEKKSTIQLKKERNKRYRLKRKQLQLSQVIADQTKLLHQDQVIDSSTIAKNTNLTR